MMLDPLDSRHKPYFSALSKKRKLTFIALTLENIALHSWRLFFWVLLFCGLWMLGLTEFIGQTLSILTSVIFSIGIFYLFKRDIFTFKFPNKPSLDSAIEKQSKLPQGHIALLDDSLANPRTYNARDLWLAAQQNILRSFKSLKTPAPSVILSRKDPSALRFIAILLFISGLMVSGNQWQHKIWRGAFPFASQISISQDKRINLWVIPPAYTQMQQTHIIGAHANGKTLDIPEGSKIKVRLYSPLGDLITPYLHMGETKLPMQYSGNGFYSIEAVIKQAQNIIIMQGFIARSKWEYNLINDLPPEIYNDLPKSEEETPTPKPYEVMSKGQIRFPLLVRDDYSVKELRMTMNIDEMIEDLPLGDIEHQTRLIMSQANIDFKISPIYDMTWHTWAGLPVTFEYTAIDHKGQTSTLEQISMTLPEREFEHPMAKSLIAMRKRLAWDYTESFIEIARNLETLLNAPDYFQNNLVTYLAINSATMRLIYADLKNDDTRINAAKEVIELLWIAAITIEDGNLSLAMRELREAQTALENAMRDPNSSEDEISALMDELREKMANYFAEMRRDMQKRIANGEDLPTMSAENFGQMISPDFLSKLMQQIESAMRAGDTQKAQELMSQLQRMMEMMDPAMGSQLPQDMQTMHEGINELQELIDGQKTLLEQTQNAAPIPSKAEQEALRYILGQLMLDASEQLDNIPEAMGLAEQEMRGSENALEAKSATTSIPHQTQAIKHLKDAQEELGKQFKARMQQMVGMGFGSSQRLDPLGRPYDQDADFDGSATGSNVKVPDDAQKKRVDEILKKLRDRSGDRSRPEEELDYFHRLLRQFER